MSHGPMAHGVRWTGDGATLAVRRCRQAVVLTGVQTQLVRRSRSVHEDRPGRKIGFNNDVALTVSGQAKHFNLPILGCLL